MEFLRTIFTTGAGDTGIWAPVILRIGLGLAILSHGIPKWKNMAKFRGYVASLKWPVPKLFARLAAIVETFGGLAILVGFLVKPSALVVAVYMLLVILTAHRGKKFSGEMGWDLPFMYLLSALALWALNDSGIFALDNLILGR